MALLTLFLVCWPTLAALLVLVRVDPGPSIVAGGLGALVFTLIIAGIASIATEAAIAIGVLL